MLLSFGHLTPCLSLLYNKWTKIISCYLHLFSFLCSLIRLVTLILSREEVLQPAISGLVPLEREMIISYIAIQRLRKHPSQISWGNGIWLFLYLSLSFFIFSMDLHEFRVSIKFGNWLNMCRYQSMLRKAVNENIVVDFSNIYNHFWIPNDDHDSKITAARLPCFDGDYWSGAVEDVMKTIEKECKEKPRRKIPSKRTLQSMGHTESSNAITKDISLMQKVSFPFPLPLQILKD